MTLEIHWLPLLALIIAFSGIGFFMGFLWGSIREMELHDSNTAVYDTPGDDPRDGMPDDGYVMAPTGNNPARGLSADSQSIPSSVDPDAPTDCSRCGHPSHSGLCRHCRNEAETHT